MEKFSLMFGAWFAFVAALAVGSGIGTLYLAYLLVQVLNKYLNG